MPEDTPNVIIRHEDATSFVISLLKEYGVSTKNAEIVAHGLVLADLRGVESHGINRLPSYLARIRHGVLDPTTEPTVKQVTPVVAQIDGHNGFGFPAAHLAMRTAILSAQAFGIGLSSVTHSNHFGMSAWLVQQALDANMMSLVFTNSSPALPAWGGKSRLLGGFTNCVWGSWGEKSGVPFILDMAPSVVARGRCIGR